MPSPDPLPNITPDHTSWPLGHMEHVGAYLGPDGWEVLHTGPGIQVPYGIYTGDNAQEAAEDVAHALWFAWDTVRRINPAELRALLAFFEPRPGIRPQRPTKATA